MKIIVTSRNPVKRNAIEQAFGEFFDKSKAIIEEVSVASGVSDQPMTEEETLKGARQRVETASKENLTADYIVGIEGGVTLLDNNDMEAFAWVYILDRYGKVGKARTGTFYLPKKIVELVNKGVELGEADDIVFAQTNSKQKFGTVGTLTRNKIDRTEYYRHAVILALIPFINPEFY